LRPTAWSALRKILVYPAALDNESDVLIFAKSVPPMAFSSAGFALGIEVIALAI